MNLVNWNVEWATPRSGRSPEILRRIDEHCPEIVCLTECDTSLLSKWDGYAVAASPNWGQSVANNRRKVLLWSRQPWTEVDDSGSDTLPPGRFIAGSTKTSLGTVAVIGVCIPWHNAPAIEPKALHRQWQAHSEYISGLSAILKRSPATPLIVVGDYNQRLGQGNYPPARLRAALQDAISPQLTIATAALGYDGRRTIDHIALSGDLAVASLAAIGNRAKDGKRLSDHFGVVASLTARNRPADHLTEE